MEADWLLVLQLGRLGTKSCVCLWLHSYHCGTNIGALMHRILLFGEGGGLPQGRIVMPLWVTTACNLQHCHNGWFGWAHCFCCNTSKHKRLKICQHYVTQSAGSTVCTCMVSTCRRPQGNRILYQQRGRRVPGHFPGYLHRLAKSKHKMQSCMQHTFSHTECNL